MDFKQELEDYARKEMHQLERNPGEYAARQILECESLDEIGRKAFLRHQEELSGGLELEADVKDDLEDGTKWDFFRLQMQILYNCLREYTTPKKIAEQALAELRESLIDSLIIHSQYLELQAVCRDYVRRDDAKEVDLVQELAQNAMRVARRFEGLYTTIDHRIKTVERMDKFIYG